MRPTVSRARRRGGASGGGGGSPAIAVTPTSGSLSLLQTGVNTVEFSLVRSGGFTGVVTPVASGLPTGVVASFSPSTFGVGVTAVTMTLTATAAPTITNDAYTVTFSGSGVSDVVYSGTVSVIATPTYGPGPNAPAWSGKTVWPEELFNTPIPVHFAGPNAAGFKGWQGFEGAWGGSYTPVRVTYPTVSTPIGTKPVMQVLFPGQTSTVNAVNGATAHWSTKHDYGVRISGTWSGAFVFERSLNGGTTWAPVTLRGTRSGDGVPVPPSGSTATVNGVWVTDTDVSQTDDTGLFRVRATSWTSGTATIAVGMRGGEAAARFNAGDFGETNPKRIYTRLLITNSPDWSDGTNTGTKGFFYTQQDLRNHFTGMFGQNGIGPFSGLQFNGSSSGTNRNMDGGIVLPRGTWADFEWIFIANTPGVANGVLRSWVNGVQYQNLTDVSYFQAEAIIQGFNGLWMDPTYGGGEAPPDNPNIWFRIAGWYRESAP